MHNNDAILRRLLTLHPKLIDLSLERMERLLAALGNPEKKLPPVVHVAGTNGKGSTVAFLKAFLEAAGYRVNVYTSPHLVNFNERIYLGGQYISDDELQAVLEECERVNAGQPITFFEITTAAAFLAFAKNPADIVLLETGLGGRLDATNVIARPRLTAITQVAMDHQHFLGDSIEAIMGEKAGILKKDVMCVAASQPARKAVLALKKAGEKIGAPIAWEGHDWFVRVGKSDITFITDNIETKLPLPALPGRHQVQNAAIAIAMARALRPDFEIPEGAVALGLKTVTWPARLQQLKNGPLVKLLPAGWELWLDGGHNRAAAEALSRHTREWRKSPLWVVFGALNTREPLEFLKPFEGRVKGLRTVAIEGEENSLNPEISANVGKALNMQSGASADVATAISEIIAQENANDARILICGSLYLAGNVLAQNN
ncbi:MAG: bifunctional folylpolyglutamate synthase/dihydrofolate synthase [Rhodospirillaceae bacterium]|nr:bifunctional folylpolyglutamate synthase/dihydrofolate synthase [Rhodospirillaceae bacterium]